jgi:hypothetical protein
VIVSGGVSYHDDLAALLHPIERIRPHPDNPSSGDVDAIATSIQISGMYRPVEAQLSTGFVLAGNTTYAACLSLDAELIPVVWLDVDDATALRILLGDNALARLAWVDPGLLTPLLDSLLDTELRLLGTGYPEPLEPTEPPDPTYMLSVALSGDTLADWLELPGDTDRARLLGLLRRDR